MERYSHRNGESEPPTEAGRYGFLGKHSKQPKSYPNQRHILFVDSVGKVEYRKPERVRPTRMPVTELVGKWWGPIIIPWESEE